MTMIVMMTVFKPLPYPGVKVLPSLHEHETLTPAPQGLFGLGENKYYILKSAFQLLITQYLLNTLDLSRSLTSSRVGI